MLIIKKTTTKNDIMRQETSDFGYIMISLVRYDDGNVIMKGYVQRNFVYRFPTRAKLEPGQIDQYACA